MSFAGIPAKLAGPVRVAGSSGEESYGDTIARDDASPTARKHGGDIMAGAMIDSDQVRKIRRSGERAAVARWEARAGIWHRYDGCEGSTQVMVEVRRGLA